MGKIDELIGVTKICLIIFLNWKKIYFVKNTMPFSNSFVGDCVETLTSLHFLQIPSRTNSKGMLVNKGETSK